MGRTEAFIRFRDDVTKGGESKSKPGARESLNRKSTNSREMIVRMINPNLAAKFV